MDLAISFIAISPLTGVMVNYQYSIVTVFITPVPKSHEPLSREGSRLSSRLREQSRELHRRSKRVPSW